MKPLNPCDGRPTKLGGEKVVVFQGLALPRLGQDVVEFLVQTVLDLGSGAGSTHSSHRGASVPRAG
jgi:hypothetical protein